MSFEKAKCYLQDKGYGDRLIVPERSSATVELAAQAIGVEPGMIAKTVSLLINGGLKAFDGGGSTFIMTWGFMRWRSLKYKCDPRIIRMLERSMDLKVRIGGDKQWICIKVH